MSVYKINLTESNKKGRVKPDFTLLPQQRRTPVIKSQPIRNFIQYTHFNNQGNPLIVQPVNNIITLLKGTTLSFGAIVEDPSNNLDPYSDTNLKFIWRQNGAEIYSISLLNDGRGSSAVYLDSKFVTPEINGVYTLEITNDFGTTTSEPFTLQIIDPLEYPLLYKNLIQNDNGSRGLENWTTDGEIAVRQMASSIIETQNFGSIWNNASQIRTNGTDLDTYQNEIPFVFGNSSNWVNFDDLFRNIQRGNTNFAREREFWYARVTPNLINNERPGQSYGAFYPSPIHVDAFNNNQDKPGNLLSSLGLTDTYFTRDNIRFNKFGGKRQVSMNQTIDISEASSLVDGNVPGVSKVVCQLFAYIGVGISKYEYKITYQDNTTTTIPTTYLLDSLQLDSVLTQEGNILNALRPDLQTKQIKQIDINPIVQDKVKINIDCLDSAGTVIDTITVNGPDETDIFAVKEKFYISEMFSTLFSISLDLQKQETAIPVLIFGKQYFELPGLGGLARNRDQITQQVAEFDRRLNSIRRQITELQNRKPNSPLQARRLIQLKQDEAILANQRNLATAQLQKVLDSLKGIQDQNRLWLLQNHPKSQDAVRLRSTNFKGLEVFLVDRFDKGAAAMFAVDKVITVPSKTRSMSVSILYDHSSKAFYDQNPNYPSTTNLMWDKEEIYGEHAADLRRYSYNNPKVGITQIKLQLFPNQVQKHPVYPTYMMPRTQVLPTAKADLFKDIHNSTQKLVYKAYTPSSTTPLTGSALDQLRNIPAQGIVNIVGNTNQGARDIIAVNITQ